ncbi:MAG: hypothetical protein SchgKO_16610 [Schleiferiaceae bacterium]
MRTATAQELYDRYKTYSARQIIELNQQIDQYSPEAQLALERLIKELGGLKEVKVKFKAELETENRLKSAKALMQLDIQRGAEKAKTIHHLVGLGNSKEEMEALWNQCYEEYQKHKKDTKITGRTVIGSLIGGALGTAIGSGIWAAQLIYSGKMFGIMYIVLGVISFGCIRLFTRQSERNLWVFSFTILSVAAAVYIGNLIFQHFGFAPTVDPMGY